MLRGPLLPARWQRMRPSRAAGVLGAGLVAGLAVGLVTGASGSAGTPVALVGSSRPPVTAHIVPLPTTTTSTTTTTTSTTTIPLNDLPVIADLATETVGLTTRLTGSTSDPDGNVVLAEVRWGDGTTDEVPGPLEALDLTHRYEAEGDYRVVVVVHDDRQSGVVGLTEASPEAVQMVEVESITLTSRNQCDRFSDDNEFVVSIHLLDDGRREPEPGDLTYFERRTMNKGDEVLIELGWQKEIRPGTGADLVFYLVETDSFAEGGNEELGPWRFDLDWPANGIDSVLLIEGGGCEAELWPVVNITEPAPAYEE